MTVNPSPDDPRRGESGRSEAPASLSFEQAVERLEEIIDRIESGEVGLERSLVEFEEGMLLLRRCREILAQAEQRVAELAPEAEGGGAGPKPARGAAAQGKKRSRTTGEADESSAAFE